ncbi:hypothetical protein K435DRAFT_816082 [Dendrothele bispora CBS 962.96]|uniref:Uncharacterized protein n=1 Tax=Dendrothele bispora (strain CBS 962.96) TaxID=1314807 RepID=A0A4S8MSJ2_DENBC|nr:hypothetical protein K435DRAFT_816082 [Dendrothele bispora CBS 962.96]
MAWFYNGHESKSFADLDNLVNDVLLADDFRKEDLADFRAKKVVRDMDDYLGPKFSLSTDDGWIETSVKIPLPAEGVKRSEADAPTLEVDGVFYRKPLEVIKTVFQSKHSQNFHYVPFKLYQQHGTPNLNDTADIRLHHELYNSDAYIQEYERIQLQQRAHQKNADLAKEPEVENVPVGIMAWSDETHVSQFGDKSMWPIYLYFGNQSKYQRAKPSKFASHHLAYIPKLPSNIQDQYKQKIGFPASAPTLTHLKRELMQAIWALILDPEFMEAYEHGILVKCGDGIIRRLFPRFFTYSADYPEKVLLATIRSLGHCPCPHCLVEKDQIRQLGTHWDRNRRERKARVDTTQRQNLINNMRRWIFDWGYRITSQAVEVVLQPFSYIPTRNTFSDRFAKFGMNFFQMFVPDVLHELELGVWKAVLTHFIRILFAYGNDTVQELDARYRQVPRFGQDTIRKIRNNVSAMKQFAARDFEDILQVLTFYFSHHVSMPVFEGLLPEHDKEVMDLLFDLATFHCLAKFRIHSEGSLQMLDTRTTELGRSLRIFDDKVCKAYDTKEIPKETAARGRRNAKKVNKNDNGSTKGKRKATTTDPTRKAFNLCTYKIHALGHYVHFIRMFGTTDNYTTQIGELEHRRVKRFYAHTNKVFRFTQQVTAHEKRLRIVEEVKHRQASELTPEINMQMPVTYPESLHVTSPRAHYSISEDKSVYKSIPVWMEENIHDLSMKDFYLKLKEHLFSRLSGKPETDRISILERGMINLKNDRIYSHKVLWVNYTTYDMRRSQDSINPRTHSNIMVHSSDPDVPYSYARVIGIFHADVKYAKQPYHQMDFLWVHWFAVDEDHQFDLSKKRLPRVGFMDVSDECAFGFIDPANVIRAVHLIPAFNLGRTKNVEGLSRQEPGKNENWWRYYVGIFSDRDMFARFVPELQLGHNFSKGQPEGQRPCEELQEDGTPDCDIDNSEAMLELSTALGPPPQDQQNEVEADVDDENEWQDYGYVESDADDSDEERQDEKGNENLGPEDGEDPLNHDMELMDIEGYGLL